MRQAIDPQMKIGEVGISDVRIDLSSRDEIPQLLLGLQAIYCNRKIRDKVFGILMSIIPKSVGLDRGRKGMNLWTILVLGTLRLNCNWDYDKLREIANNHKTVRQMIGHDVWDDRAYALQTLKDNVALFTPEVLDQINRVVVGFGHRLIGEKAGRLLGSCDSSVVETNVHFPTDVGILWDAVRKMVFLAMQIFGSLGLPAWRQGRHHVRKAKKLCRKAARLKRSSSKDPEKRKERERLIVRAHEEYLELAESFVRRIWSELPSVQTLDPKILANVWRLENFLRHAERQIDQIRRRVVDGESIPHHEKVFSVFEEHTEWIVKGKTGVPVELGLNVCFLKDQFGFILHHRVMEGETDDKIAVPMVEEALERFPALKVCTFDKGYHSPANQEKLAGLLEQVVLPRKGKLSAENREIENSDEFREGRRKHSAVESSIHALKNHGVDRCPDRGIHGFKRYVALAVVARNIQILGALVQKRELRKARREELQKAA